MEQKGQHAKALRIVSRPKCIDGVVHEAGVIVLRCLDLEKHFSSPLFKAAKDLGVSATALQW
jgi:hypothetical protein